MPEDNADLLELTPSMEQDPLPENSWFWRRSYTFVLSIVSLGFIWYGIEALWDMRDGQHIYYLTRYMIGILFVLILFYMVAPSAEQIVKLIQAARLIRENIPTTTRTTIAENAAGGRTQTTTESKATPAAPAPVIVPVPVPAGDEDDVAPRSKT